MRVTRYHGPRRAGGQRRAGGNSSGNVGGPGVGWDTDKEGGVCGLVMTRDSRLGGLRGREQNGPEAAAEGEDEAHRLQAQGPGAPLAPRSLVDTSPTSKPWQTRESIRQRTSGAPRLRLTGPAADRQPHRQPPGPGPLLSLGLSPNLSLSPHRTLSPPPRPLCIWLPKPLGGLHKPDPV